MRTRWSTGRYCNVIFYNGVSLNISNVITSFPLTPNVKEDISRRFKIVGSIFKRLPKVRFLTLEEEDSEMFWWYHAFPAQKLCKIDVHEIEKLKVIGRISLGTWEAFFKQEEFSSLKVATFPQNFFEDDASIDILQQVLSASPVLQEWSPEITESHIKYFAQANKLAVLKTLEIDISIEADVVDQIEASNVTLRRLCLNLVRATPEGVEIFRRITVASTASLQILLVHYRFCKMLVSTLGMGPFINVKKLFLITLQNRNSEHQFKNMKAEMKADSNFERMFPNAKILCCVMVL